MALQPTLTSYLRKISANNVRYFAAAAAKAQPKESQSQSSSSSLQIPAEELKTSTEGNVNVVSQETNKPLARLAVYFKAGSRYENDSNQGVVHALRIAAGLGTEGTTRFGLARVTEAHGGIMTCTAGREHIAYTIEATRDKIENLIQLLADASSKQVFKPWEIKDTIPRLHAELQTMAPETRTLELVHKAAFRRGLGYSLYSPKANAGKISQAVLSDFTQNNFVEASVVGIGVPHDLARKLARRVRVTPKERTVEASRFYSHEIRKETSGDVAYVALAIQGAGLSNAKDAVASALVQRALGAGARLKRGNMVGKLSALNSDSSIVTSFNVNYSDAGLLGVLLVGTSNVMGSAVKKAADTLRRPNLSEDDIARAKSILKNDIAFALESEGELADDIGLQSLFNGSVLSQAEISTIVDSVTAADVNALVSKGAGKLALASVGNLSKVPYLDEL